MACPPVRGDNPRFLASRLYNVQVDSHSINIFCHQHCRLFNLGDNVSVVEVIVIPWLVRLYVGIIRNF